MSGLTPSTTYSALLKNVRKTLIEGQRRIEAERVKVYWETGRIIHTHILQNQSRAEYGTQVIAQLSGDLNVHESLLNRCVKFAQVYPRLSIPATWQELTWSHYRQLITISDDKTRAAIEQKVAQKEWTARELSEELKKIRPAERTPSPAKKNVAPITPSPRGALYTYAVLDDVDVFKAKGKVFVDCGFNEWRLIKKADWPQAVLKAKNEYTYRARLDRVVDGDTLRVVVELGLDAFSRQYLRLKSVNAPELSTPAGQAAKRFLQKVLRAGDLLTIVTSKSDKYDRYLADVWIGDEYINQRIIDEGFAEVWGG